MGPPLRRSAFTMPTGTDVHLSMKRLRSVAGVMALGTVAVFLGAGAGMAVRLARPVRGGLAWVLVAGGVGLVALIVGLGLLVWGNRQAKRAEAIKAAAGAYLTGCAVAGAANFAAGVVTVGAIFSNGLSKGLWVPQVLVLAVNLLGLVLAVPKVEHLRRLHYSPTLPTSRT